MPKIELTNSQFALIIEALQHSGAIYSILGDFVDKKLKKKTDSIDEFEAYLLSMADDFNFKESIEEFEGKKHLSEESSLKYLDVVLEYDDYNFWSSLVEKLSQAIFLKVKGKPFDLKNHKDDDIRFFSELEEKLHTYFENGGFKKLELKDFVL